MNQNLAESLELTERLQTLRSLPSGKVMQFAFLPGDDVLILSPRTKQDRQKAATLLRNTPHGGEVNTDTAWCGEVWWAEDHAAFRVDPKRSSGAPMNVKVFRTALLAMARDLKGCTALRDPEIVRPADKVMDSETLRAMGGEVSWKAKLGSGSTYYKILKELDALKTSKSNAEHREHLNTLLRRIDRWLDGHDGDEDKQTRANAVSYLRDQVVDELARTLEEGRFQPTPQERDVALGVLSEGLVVAIRSPAPSVLARTAGRVERWADLGVRVPAEQISALGGQMAQQLQRGVEPSTPDLVKAASRLVRRVRQDLFATDDPKARRELILSQQKTLLALLRGLEVVSNTRGEEHAALRELAVREMVKVDRDLNAIVQQIELQNLLDQGQSSFTGEGGKPKGASGSYFLGRGGQRVAVFKPTTQEVPPPLGWKPGDGARGEVLTGRLAQLLGERLGQDLGVPRSEVVVLQDEVFSTYVPDRYATVPGQTDPCQVGVTQTFVPTSHGELGGQLCYSHPRLGLELPVSQVQRGSEVETIKGVLRELPNLDWEQLSEREQLQLVNEVLRGPRKLVFPEETNLDELAVSFDKVALLDICSLQTDRNVGNLLLDVGDHSRVVAIDQALSLPTLTIARKCFTSTAVHPFTAWMEAPGHDRPLTTALRQQLQGLDVDAVIGDMQLEAEQVHESSGGRVPPLPMENLELLRLSMRAVRYAVNARPTLTRRQLGNIVCDLDEIPWIDGENKLRKSPMSVSIRRLGLVKGRLADELVVLEGTPNDQREDRRDELFDHGDLLSRTDFEEEWTSGMKPSLDLWIQALG